jgi:hypothetical protein
MWAFWIACGLTITGAVLPLLLVVGTSSRISGVAIPFAVAAVAFAVNALIYHQGRPLAAVLYFIAGLAIVYGILALLTVPLRLAVVGTCPASQASCPSNFERVLTVSEDAGLTIAVAMGVLAILTGFFGLLMLYRRSAPRAVTHSTPLWPDRPPEAAAAEPAPASPSAAAPPASEASSTPETSPAPEAPATVTPATAASPAPAAKRAPKAKPAPVAEPAEPMLELEPPATVLELPPPPAEPAPKPTPRPRLRRTPRAKLEPEPPSTSGDAPPTTPES